MKYESEPAPLISPSIRVFSSATLPKIPPALAFKAIASEPVPADSSIIEELVAPVTSIVRSSASASVATVRLDDLVPSILTPPAVASISTPRAPVPSEVICNAEAAPPPWCYY